MGPGESGRGVGSGDLAAIIAIPSGIWFCRSDRDLPGIHWGCGLVPAALCFPAEDNPARDEGGHRCGDLYVWEERAGKESLLDLLHLDGWTGARPGAGSGDNSADCRTNYGDGHVVGKTRFITLFFIGVLPI